MTVTRSGGEGGGAFWGGRFCRGERIGELGGQVGGLNRVDGCCRCGWTSGEFAAAKKIVREARSLSVENNYPCIRFYFSSPAHVDHKATA